MEKIQIKIPAKEIYLKSLRLFASSIASDIGFNIEEVEDIRVVVSEAVNYKLRDGDQVVINFFVKEKELEVEVIGKDKEIEETALKMRNLILESLADQVEVDQDIIRLTKRVQND